MVKNKISKIIALIITFVLITFISTTVFAAGQLDLGDITGEETEENGEEEEVEDLTGDIEQEEEEKKPVEKEEEKSESKYEESDIPYAGPEDTILMVAVFAILGGVCIFTFIKLSEYSNI